MDKLHLMSSQMDILILLGSWDNACLNAKTKCLRVMNNWSMSRLWRSMLAQKINSSRNNVFWTLLKLEIFQKECKNLTSPSKSKAKTKMVISTFMISEPLNHNQKTTLYSTSVSNLKFKTMTIWSSSRSSIRKLKILLGHQRYHTSQCRQRLRWRIWENIWMIRPLKSRSCGSTSKTTKQPKSEFFSTTATVKSSCTTCNA